MNSKPGLCMLKCEFPTVTRCSLAKKMAPDDDDASCNGSLVASLVLHSPKFSIELVRTVEETRHEHFRRGYTPTDHHALANVLAYDRAGGSEKSAQRVRHAPDWPLRRSLSRTLWLWDFVVVDFNSYTQDNILRHILFSGSLDTDLAPAWTYLGYLMQLR